jgi:hypothetical protein
MWSKIVESFNAGDLVAVVAAGIALLGVVVTLYQWTRDRRRREEGEDLKTGILIIMKNRHMTVKEAHAELKKEQKNDKSKIAELLEGVSYSKLDVHRSIYEMLRDRAVIMAEKSKDPGFEIPVFDSKFAQKLWRLKEGLLTVLVSANMTVKEACTALKNNNGPVAELLKGLDFEETDVRRCLHEMLRDGIVAWAESDGHCGFEILPPRVKSWQQPEAETNKQATGAPNKAEVKGDGDVGASAGQEGQDD